MNTPSRLICCLLLITPVYALALEWTPLTWLTRATSRGMIVKEVLAVDVKLQGSNGFYKMQLDTGAEDSFIFLNSVVGDPNIMEALRDVPTVTIKTSYSHVTGYGARISGQIAGDSFSSRPFLTNTRFGGKNAPTIGLAGLSAFSSSILVIDFVKNRIAISNNLPEIIYELGAKFEFNKFTLDHGTALLPITSGGKDRGNFVLDTGASQFGLVVHDRIKWSEMTGREINDVRNNKTDGPNWDGNLACQVAPALDDIKINQINLGKLELANCLENNLSKDFSEIDGLIGNAAFIDKGIVIIDRLEQQIGISLLR
ncbi:hypothetical protein [Undibacterium sp.]|uniref:hypothetical protein n=1 Tax=Undibacterium sp. TaxID=1914977 RepID=UPI0025D8B239|nr:hypothetical protein [Undibacterium sp.]